MNIEDWFPLELTGLIFLQSKVLLRVFSNTAVQKHHGWKVKYCIWRNMCLNIKTSYASVQFSHIVMSDSLQPHGLQHARLPCPSPTPRAWSNSCPSSRWCHPTISSSVIPFSSCLPSFPASGSFPVSQFFTSGDQSIGASASTSVLPMNIQDWFPLGLTGLISLLIDHLKIMFREFPLVA